MPKHRSCLFEKCDTEITHLICTIPLTQSSHSVRGFYFRAIKVLHHDGNLEVPFGDERDADSRPMGWSWATDDNVEGELPGGNEPTSGGPVHSGLSVVIELEPRRALSYEGNQSMERCGYFGRAS